MNDKTHEGLPVKGYQPQTAQNVGSVNANKEAEERLLRMLDGLMNSDADKRWLAIARTHFEEGFMAMNRAIFKPQRIRLGDETDVPQDHR